MNRTSLEDLSLAKFAEQLKTKFRVRLSSGETVELELTEAEAARGKAAHAQPESFSLLFDGPPKSLLNQNTYTFEHERLGAVDLFIVPVGNERGSIQYQVIINQVGPR